MSGGGGQNPRLNAPSFHQPIDPRPYAPPSSAAPNQFRPQFAQYTHPYGQDPLYVQSHALPPNVASGIRPAPPLPPPPQFRPAPPLQHLPPRPPLFRPQNTQPYGQDSLHAQSHAPPPSVASGVRPAPPLQHPPPRPPQFRPQNIHPYGQDPLHVQSHAPPPNVASGVRPAPPLQHPAPPPPQFRPAPPLQHPAPPPPQFRPAPPLQHPQPPPPQFRPAPPLQHPPPRPPQFGPQNTHPDRRVTGLVAYMPILDFFAKHPATEPYQFVVGSSFGRIPQGQITMTTILGASTLDGCVEFLFSLHAADKSYGGNFDVSDILVSEHAPHHVMIKNLANKPATESNICKDLDKLVVNLVMPTYGEDGDRPPYLEDFVAQVDHLHRAATPEQWHQRRWVIKNHPLLVESGKRRLVLEDFYKFYKTLNPDAALKLFTQITGNEYQRWHVLIAPQDPFISSVYWKGREELCPPDHFVRDYIKYPCNDEEDPNLFRFTSQHGYLAVFLRHLLVHGPEEALFAVHAEAKGELWYGIELKELELIIAYYFGEFLSTFLAELYGIAHRFDMIREILNEYAARRPVSREISG